jgi:hypothetical protein
MLWRLIPGRKKSTPTTIAPKKGLKKGTMVDPKFLGENMDPVDQLIKDGAT